MRHSANLTLLSFALVAFACAYAVPNARAGEGSDADRRGAEEERRKTEDQPAKPRQIVEKEGAKRDPDRQRNSQGLVSLLLEHAEELNLSADQKAELKSSQAMREKVESDPRIRELFAQLQEATVSMDDEQFAPLVEKITARKAELGAGRDKAPLNVLTDEQRKKWTALRAAQLAGEPARKRDGDRRNQPRDGEATRKGDSERREPNAPAVETKPKKDE